jgi:hypothetical protein
MNGWYYDEQLNNPLTSISLHPNQLYVNQEWVNVTDRTIDNVSHKPDNEEFVTQAGDKIVGYDIVPIATSIISEDFNVAIANTWSPYGSGEEITSLWNSFRSAAPYVDSIRKGLKEVNKTLEIEEGDGAVVTFLKSVGGLVSNNYDANLGLLQHRLNDHLVTQGTRFSYYAGSGTAFGGLGMKYTIFPKFDNVNGFVSVIEQIQQLYPYVNGKLETETYDAVKNAILDWKETVSGRNKIKEKGEAWFNSAINSVDKLIDDAKTATGKGEVGKAEATTAWTNLKSKFKEITDTTLSIADDILKAILDAGLLAWQKAPGGFKPYYKDIDIALQGTLKLRIGTQYSISSLLCQDVSLNFSKAMVKNPIDGTISPLYCDVTLNLIPATKFSNISLEKFVKGHLNPNKDTISEELNKKLQQEKELIQRTYLL